MAFAYPRRGAFRPRPKAKALVPAAARKRPQPSSALVNAVLEHADLRDDMGGGRVLLRLSPEQAADLDLRGALGAEAVRLSDVAVIWDEREDQIFRVLDGAAPHLTVVETPEEAEEDRFELTPAALRYIAQSQSRRRN
jgi:hypothetical protein